MGRVGRRLVYSEVRGRDGGGGTGRRGRRQLSEGLAVAGVGLLVGEECPLLAEALGTDVTLKRGG